MSSMIGSSGGGRASDEPSPASSSTGLFGRSWGATLLAWGVAVFLGLPVWSVVHLWLGMDSSWTVPAGVLGVVIADALVLGGPLWWARGLRLRGLQVGIYAAACVLVVLELAQVLRGPNP